MTLQNDVEKRVYEKLAALKEGSMFDTASNYLSDALGGGGSLSTPLMAGGAGLISALAGKNLGLGSLGTLGIGGLGALLGGGVSNAINTQGQAQNAVDRSLIGGVSAGLQANDQTDQMQNQAIMQTNDNINTLAQGISQLMGSLGGGMGMAPPMDPNMGMAPPPMDPNMGMAPPPMDPNMGMAPPPQMGGGMGMAPPPPMGPENNGLGMGQPKMGQFNDFEKAVYKTAGMKLAKLFQR